MKATLLVALTIGDLLNCYLEIQQVTLVTRLNRVSLNLTDTHRESLSIYLYIYIYIYIYIYMTT